MIHFQKMTGLQKDAGETKQSGKSSGGRAVLTAVCVLVMAFTAAGCGKAEEPVPVKVSSGNVEEIQNDTAGDPGEPEAMGEDKADSENDTGEGKGPADDTADDTADEAQTGDGEGGDPAAQDNAQEDSGQQKSAGSASLEGDVLSVSQDSFVIARVETWLEGDASYAVATAPGCEEEEEKITVHVGQGCGWKLKTVKNGGVSPEDVSTAEGSFADLKEGVLTHMKGSWQDDGSFLADNIEIMIFV